MSVCTKCELHRHCKSVCLSGFGPSESPTLLLVGKDPNDDEDLLGRAGLGRDGKDLKSVLSAVGFIVDQCRFTNVIRCHVPKKSNPTKDQIATCLPYLFEEIQACTPSAIICLGKEAAQAVLSTSEKMTSLRGRPYEVRLGSVTYPVFVTHHPRRLYMQNSLIPEFASDLQMAHDYLQGTLLQGSDLAVEVLDNLEALDAIIDHLETSREPFAWDLETVNTYPYLSTSRILCLGFCFDPDFAYTIPVTYGLEEDATPFGDQAVALWEQQVLSRIKRLMELPNPKYGHNGSFDYLWLKIQYGITVKGIEDDTLLLHYSLDERVGTHGLDKLAVRVGMAGYDTPMKPYYNDSYNKAPWPILSRYNGLDCIATYRLWKELKPLVYSQPGLKFVYENLLIPSVEKITWVTENGVAVDGVGVEAAATTLRETQDRLDEQITAIASEVGFQEKYMELRQQKHALAYQSVKAKMTPAYEKWCQEGNDPTKFRWKKATKVKASEVKFSAASSQKLAFMLYDILHLPVLKRTPTKNPSTEAEVLTKLSARHPLPNLIIEHRSVSKELSTYVAMLREYTVKGLIHPGFKMFSAVTGRTSSADPPLQNFPVKSPLRNSFVSRWGEEGILVEVDQSQMELRVMASMSQDPTLMEAYCTESVDVHTQTASKVFGVPMRDTVVEDANDVLARYKIAQDYLLDIVKNWWALGKSSTDLGILGLPPTFASKYYLDQDYNLYLRGVTKDQRSKAKTINFAILYLSGPKGLAEQLGCRESEAEALIRSYFLGYPKVEEYIESVKREVHKKKQLVSMFGRIRRLPEIDSSESEIVAEAERQAVNFTIQSPASDITILAYYKLYDWMQKERVQSTVWNLVHDAIHLDCPLQEWVPVTQHVVHYMESPVSWMRVPLRADVSIGQTWAQCKAEDSKVTDLPKLV